jgi:hypothetical protein
MYGETLASTIFDTAKVDPQMRVMLNRYSSARGMRALLGCVVMMSVVLVNGCEHGDAPRIDRVRMVQVQTDLLVLGELHRGDSLATRSAIDARLRALGVTRTDVEQSLEWYARHPAELDSLLKDVDRRLDTTRQSPPPID